MATNTDFDDLIARIDTATNTLEQATTVIDSNSQDIAQAVIDAQAARDSAQQAVLDAQAEADNAGASAQSAEQSYLDAEALVTQLEAAVIIEEAPIDGQTYGRKDGAWVLSGAGGSGTVTSVNSVLPDGTGDVTLTPANIGALADTYSPAWVDITGKPTFATVATSGAYSDLSGTPTLSTVATSGDYNDLLNQPTIPTATSDLTNDSGYITDAPSDGTQYARVDAGWQAVSVEPEAVPYTVPSNKISVGGSYVTEWVSDNPHETYAINDLQMYLSGRFKQGEEIFYDPSNADPSQIPWGKYHFLTSTFTQGPLQSKDGYIEVTASENAENYIVAFVNPATGDTAGEVYIWNNPDGEFIAVGSSSGGGSAGGFSFDETGFYYEDSAISEWPETNPNKGLDMSKCGAYVGGTWTTGPELFATTDGIQEVPEGTYYTPSTWPDDSRPFANEFVTIEVKSRASRKQAVAYVFTEDYPDIAIYILRDGSGADTWYKVSVDIPS